MKSPKNFKKTDKFQKVMNSNPIFGMHQITHIFDIMADKLLKDCCGINYNKFMVLAPICGSVDHEITQKQISDFTNLTEASVSRIVTEFIDQDLIMKEINPANRSMHFLTTTEKGLELFIKAMSVLDKESKKLISTIGNDEITVLNSSLTKIKKLLCH